MRKYFQPISILAFLFLFASCGKWDEEHMVAQDWTQTHVDAHVDGISFRKADPYVEAVITFAGIPDEKLTLLIAKEMVFEWRFSGVPEQELKVFEIDEVMRNIITSRYNSTHEGDFYDRWAFLGAVPSNGVWLVLVHHKNAVDSKMEFGFTPHRKLIYVSNSKMLPTRKSGDD